MKREKPVYYTPELGKRIAERYAGGESLTAICRDEAMPHKVTVTRWLTSQPGFSELMTHARDAHADWRADEVIDIADSEPDPQRARVKVDARKWAAKVLNPQRYGDKLDLNVNERPRVGDVLAAARARLSRPMRDQLAHDAAQAIEYKTETDGAPTDGQSGDEPVDIFS